MTTVAKKGALHLVDWGPLRYKAFHFLMGMDTKHKYHADMLWGWSSCPGCVWGGTSITTVLSYKHSGTFRFARLSPWGSTKLWIAITSTEE